MKVTLTKEQLNQLLTKALQTVVTDVEILNYQPVERKEIKPVERLSDTYLISIDVSEMLELIPTDVGGNDKITVIKNFREWSGIHCSEMIGLIHAKWMVENVSYVRGFLRDMGRLPELTGNYPHLTMN